MYVLNIGLDHPTRGPARQLYETLKVMRDWGFDAWLAERVHKERTLVVYTTRNYTAEQMTHVARAIDQDSIAVWDCQFGRGWLSGPNSAPYGPFDKAKFIF